MHTKFMIIINQICVMTWQQFRIRITMFCYCKSLITRRGLLTLMLSKQYVHYDMELLKIKFQGYLYKLVLMSQLICSSVVFLGGEGDEIKLLLKI